VLTRWPTLSQRGPYNPSVGLVDHSNDLRYDFVARVVERFEGLPIDVVVVKSNVEDPRRRHADTPTRSSPLDHSPNAGYITGGS
jgi:hypothetical protein